MATIKKQLTLTFKQPNIAESYGPYISVSAAHAALSEDQLNVIGMTVGIQTGNTIEEYWYQGGTEQANLVKKQSSDVEANPEGTPSSILNKIKIGETIYTAPQGPVGPNGTTPHIGDNGDWYIGDQDTGVQAEGQDGQNGAPGQNAVNPFKGYFNSLSDLQTKYPTGETGDFANVYDSTATYRYIWDASLATPAWVQALDSNNTPIEVTPSTATFNSGESVVNVSIVDFETGGTSNVPNAASVKQLNEKLYGVPSGQTVDVEEELAMGENNKLRILMDSSYIQYNAGNTNSGAYAYMFDVSGLSRIRIYPNPNSTTGAAYVAIFKKQVPAPTGNTSVKITSSNMDEYLATGCTGYVPDSVYRMAIRLTHQDVQETGYHEITLSANAKYVYCPKTILMGSPVTVMECSPLKVASVTTEQVPEEVGDIDRLDARIDVIEAGCIADAKLKKAVYPCPPSLHNIKVASDGSVTTDNTVLTTDIIHGDFFCTIASDYRIRRVIRVDESGNVVNYHLVTNKGDGGNTVPFGAMDYNNYPTAYGTAWTQPYYGVILEIQHKDCTTANPVEISPDDNVISIFKWEDSKLKSEILTLDKYNGESATDAQTAQDVVYEKESVINFLKRAKTCVMLDWTALKDLQCTSENTTPPGNEWLGKQYLAGSHQTGVPYSRANPRDKWFGLNCSPTTFVTASMHPYSVLYTELIGTSASSTYSPFHSEYGVTSYGSEHGTPYYGLVCSSFASYALGLPMPIQTSNLATSSNTIKIAEVGYGATQSPFDAYSIPPLSIITTPGHTYMVVDFLLNEYGERVYAILIETTYPNTKATLYKVSRLQTRFNGEYSKVNTNQKKIQLSIPTPTKLYAHKDKNLWDTPYNDGFSGSLNNYATRKLCDPNVMFYMGDKAVVMKYDTTNYAKNDSCWLIVKPEDVYTTVQVEKYNNATGTWSNVGSKTIATDKQSYSDNNTDYYKIDVTSLCSTKGKYRAYLTDGTNNTGYTEWIVLDVSLYKDGSNIRWTVNNNDSSDGDDDYATVVAANKINSVGQPYSSTADLNEETNVSNGYIGYSSSSSIYARVVVKCAFGTASRYKVMSTFS